MQYDLEERVSKFGEDIIGFVGSLPKDDVLRILVNQIVRSATSIGANYMEANNASSKKDFKNKINICRKEANETKHWLRMIKKAYPLKEVETGVLWKEAHELTLIFKKISSSCESK